MFQLEDEKKMRRNFFLSKNYLFHVIFFIKHIFIHFCSFLIPIPITYGFKMEIFFQHIVHKRIYVNDFYDRAMNRPFFFVVFTSLQCRETSNLCHIFFSYTYTHQSTFLTQLAMHKRYFFIIFRKLFEIDYFKKLIRY